MFWKLALTITVALMALGRAGPQRNLLIRLLLPREWAARLIPPPAPARPRSGSGSGSRPRPAAAEPEAPVARSSPWGDRAYLLLVVTAATAVAAWIVTHALITSDPAVSP
ncbi:hypothetical protein BH23PLA1_BH23PLA1_01350 [soil metagenome]